MNLWYKQEASKWVEALPVGNGRIGGMVFGKTDAEIISLNEDTLWSGYPRNLNPRGKADVYKQVRDLAMAKKFHEAQTLFEDELTSGWTESYLPLGDLVLTLNHKNADKYKRSLDLETASASTVYRCNGITYTREVFVSAPDNVMVIALSADTSGSISLTLEVKSQLKASLKIADGMLVMEGIAPSSVEPSYSHDLAEPVLYSDKDAEKGMRFALMALPVVYGGKVSFDNGSISISGADRVMILVSATTSFVKSDIHPYLHGADEKSKCKTALEKVKKLSYEDLFARHSADYQKYYHRVSIFLGENDKALLPTDERLRGFLTDHNDPALYALLYQYGRYLLISSSRPGTQAANLQGIWNKELRAPWSSNFTININTQMNYWPVFSCGLGELNEPLKELIKGIAKKGTETAKEMYGARGFTSHHNADIWHVSWAVGNHKRGTGVYAAWNMSAPWLCRHLFDEYEYTRNRSFLEKTAYPIMKEAAIFLKDLLVKDEKGRYMLCPSTSPENSFIWEGQPVGMARTSTMTMAMVKELFGNCITACTILGNDKEFAEELKALMPELYPFQIGSKGQLLEWDDEYEEKEPHHRHTSHLYGLHPSHLISPDKTPELADACRRTLELRGDDGTGWSLSWKVNFWARLWDGNHALAILNNQLRLVEEGDTKYSGGGGTYPNMFDAHPPFQIDGNFGVASGITEMFLQNMDGGLHLLPALPDSWKSGHCTGLCGKKQIKVDIFWNGDTAEAVLFSPEKQQLVLYYRGKKYKEVLLPANEQVKILL